MSNYNLDNIIVSGKTKTIYRDNDKLIKSFDKEFTKADVLNEALNGARVENTEINVPRIYEVSQINGKWSIVSEFIEGTTFAEIMKNEPEKRYEYLEIFLELQLKIHSQRCPLLNKLKDKMARKIQCTTLDAATKYDLQTRLEAMPKNNKICHGDFNPQNIIVKDDGSMYVIDWAHATQGNASADIARTYLLFCLNGEADTAKKYLELFCKKTDTPKAYVQSWIPIVAASQSVKGNNNEREFLLHWVSVVDYQ